MTPDQELSEYPPLAQTLLKNRGIETREEAEAFLNPSYENHIYDPFLILNMDRAVERIFTAIDGGESIIIYGDYDCDGIPGSVVLHDLFKKIGYRNVRNYIPHRHNEGYGLNIPAIEQFAQDGVKLLITVDCGITDVAQVARARELGIDVIITDHHLPQEILPDAYAIINSKQVDDTYPDPMLCGAAVAWKLSCAILEKGRARWDIPRGWEKWLLDMAGLSTIADMVPLRDENRVLAYYGLKVLRKSKRPGLKKLLSKMGTQQEYLTEDDIGFMIAPRINAASRMSIPFEGFELLATDDVARAEELAKHLTQLNDTRKTLVASMVKDARKHLDARAVESSLSAVIVIGNPSWRPGLAGLVAGNLAEHYERTVFVWGRADDGTLKGSCRSDGTVNLVTLMTSVREEIFLHKGGHELSGGFSISHDQIHFLEEELACAYEGLRREKEDQEIFTDATLSLREVTWSTWNIVERFAPFGMGNAKPTFLFEDVVIAKNNTFGKTKEHRELTFAGSSVKAIAFFADEKTFSELHEGDRADLIATFEESRFRGRRELRLRIVSIEKRR